ncbi:MAG: hypothetical protein JSR67_05310 [Proteobacteria bacterium]|nr:hypothetical protein [Pseudomonadota bacterium]
MRIAAATSLYVLALLPSGALHAAAQPTAADTQLVNYAFASELGSGIYEIDGRTLQVYQLEPGYTLRTWDEGAPLPGLRLVFPLTFGFFNFATRDLAELHLPSSIGAVSFKPGLVLDYHLHPRWHLRPYAKGGVSFASSTRVNSLIYSVGIRSDYSFPAWGTQGLWRAELVHAGVRYMGSLPNDAFTRLRDSVELRRAFDVQWREHRLELSPYLVTDVYLNAPNGPGSGISARTLQLEAGLMWGVRPMWQVLGMSLPRLGVGYRQAGILSGWRLVIGDPF